MLHLSQSDVDDFAQDIEWLWATPGIPVLQEPPSAITFLREYVSVSRPCIIRLSEHFPRMSLDDIADKFDIDGEAVLNVDVSPDGHADAVRLVCQQSHDSGDDGRKKASIPLDAFVKPEERSVSIREFRQLLRNSSGLPSGDSSDRIFNTSLSEVPCPGGDEELPHDEDAVVYYSRQNDCFRRELPSLWNRKFFPESFSWAEEAFGTGPPQAVNLWIGNERSVSSMHKDHYENLFVVLSGEKIFTLCPPADAPFLYEKEHSSWQFRRDATGWSVVPELDEDGNQSKVRWIQADVTRRDEPNYLARYPLLQHAHPRKVVVKAGFMLYLPSLWFHRVTQTCETVGINYWYDMKFESPLWCYFHLLQRLRETTTEVGQQIP